MWWLIVIGGFWVVSVIVAAVWASLSAQPVNSKEKI
jgi:hypothetical protein